MHRDWCGSKCALCAHPCCIDVGIPCSPDCELLGEDGEPIDHKLCIEAGCDAIEDEEDE